MKRIIIFTSLIVVLFLAIPRVKCEDRTYLVQGSPTTWNVPADFPTIQEAINAALPEDTIYVAAGTYYEHLSIISKSNLTIIGENPSNTIIDGNGTGSVIFISAGNVTIRGFTVQNGIYGINMNQASNSTIENNLVTANEEDGLFLRWESNNNKISNNTISLNGAHAIRADESCSQNTITTNALTQNGRGMVLSNCRHFVLRDNNMTNNVYNFGVFGSSPIDFTHDIDTSNVVDEKLIYYLVNKSNLTIDSSAFPNLGYLALVNSHNITVSNLASAHNYQGVLFANTTHSSIKGVNASQNLYGLHLVFSNHNDVSNNVVKTSAQGVIGIQLSNSKSNTLTHNHLDSCQAGIYLISYSSDNTIVENRITRNQYGISTQVFSSSNLVYNNDFVSNTQQAATSSYSYNIWDNGYPSGGNYWSDYDGEDLHSGPDQNQPGSDGIGDTPYIINSDNQDNYPLMDPLGDSTNIAITNVTADPTAVYIGKTVNISVTVTNESTLPQTFNVTAFYDNNPIGIQLITNLASDAETTTTFYWNTTTVAPQNYSIRAEADIISGEVNQDDNTYVDGTVEVKILGDINGDGVVDIFDLSTVAAAYGSRTGQPKYNPDADINEDGIVDIRDVAVVCRNYGNTCNDPVP